MDVQVFHYLSQGVTAFQLERSYPFLTVCMNGFDRLHERFQPFVTFLRNGQEPRLFRNGQESRGAAGKVGRSEMFILSMINGTKRSQNHANFKRV